MGEHGLSDIYEKQGWTWSGGRGWWLLLGLMTLLFVQAWLMTSDGAADPAGLLERSASPIYTWLVTPFAALGLGRAALVINVILLAVSSCLTARVLQKRWGSTAPVVVSIYLFGSVVFARALLAEPQILLLSSTLLAFVLISRAERPLAHDTPEIYYEPNLGRRVLLRWFLAGLLLAIPAVHDPIYLCLLPPALVSLPRSKKGLASVSLIAGALVLVGLVFAAGDANSTEAGVGKSRQSEIADSDRRSESTRSPQTIAEETIDRWSPRLRGFLEPPDWSLFAWNSLYFLVGRNLGILPYYLPLLLILAGWGTSRREAVLIGSVILAALLALWVHPFNFAGGNGGLGNGRFLPLYGALWFLPTKRVRRAAIVGVALMAACFVWPIWASPQSATRDSIGTANYASKLPFRLLPYEISQRGLPQFGAFDRPGLRVRSLTPEIEFDSNRDRLVLMGSEWCELLISSESELTSVFLDFDKNASSDLVVAGGELTDTIFRPDGRIAFQVGVQKPNAQYADESSGEALFHYRLRLRMLKTKGALFSVKGLIIDGKSGESGQ